MANVEEKERELDEIALAIGGDIQSGEAKELSNKILKKKFKEKGFPVTTERFTNLRMVLPFTQQMIIPELKQGTNTRREKSPMEFRKLSSQKEFDEYKLTENNFRVVSQKQIDYIVEKMEEKGFNDKVTVLKLITIVDTILAHNEYDVYTTINKRILKFYLRVQENELEVLLGLLVEMGVLSCKGKMGKDDCLYRVNSPGSKLNNTVVSADFQQIRDDRDKSPQKVLTTDSVDDNMITVSDRENALADAALEKFAKTVTDAELVTADDSAERQGLLIKTQTDEGLDALTLIREAVSNGVAKLDTERKLLIKEKDYAIARAKQLEEENADLNKKLSALLAANEQMGKVLAENEKLKKDHQQYAENIKDYKGFKKVVKGRVEKLMDRLTEKLTKSIDAYEIHRSKGRLLREMSYAIEDTSKSLVSSATTMKK